MLFKAIEGLNVEIPNNLRIILLSNDYKIRINYFGSIDWIKIVKELIESKELGLLVRVLRYLQCFDLDSEEVVPLILLNSLNKVIMILSKKRVIVIKSLDVI